MRAFTDESSRAHTVPLVQYGVAPKPLSSWLHTAPSEVLKLVARGRQMQVNTLDTLKHSRQFADLIIF